jgi:hypothetical protein
MAVAARRGLITVASCRLLGTLLVAFLSTGCRYSVEVPDPDVKQNLRSFLEVYQMYTNERKMPPADEASLRSYVEGMPADKKAGVFLPDKLDKLFVSARDGKKFVIKYGLMPDPAGEPTGLAWEETGKGGKRFVALTMGYVEEYDEASFQALKK